MGQQPRVFPQVYNADYYPQQNQYRQNQCRQQGFQYQQQQQQQQPQPQSEFQHYQQQQAFKPAPRCNQQFQYPNDNFGAQQRPAPIVIKKKDSIGIPSNFLDQFMKANNGGLAVPKQIKKKKIASLTNKKEPIRPVRPKVVPSKGAVQCMGKNLKKGTQCKNAALMEFFGPRPIYCAEHIELDPNSIYCKCLSPYNKEPGDKKGCKEVVLKEFSFCYKHFEFRLESYSTPSAILSAKKDLARVSELLEKLELEASIAKKQRHDLFQRKNKLIPKFVAMKKALEEFIAKQPTKPQEAEEAIQTPSFACPGDLVNTSFLYEFNFDEEWKNLAGP